MSKKIRKSFLEKRKNVEKDVKTKLNMFDRLPDNCMACLEPFDKTSFEQVSKWQVVVKEEKVSLYCPTCWAKAIEAVKSFAEKEEE